ncbi:hypothetical protein [Methylophilus medardicus]|nr:hypothetical protein [Methylophilus medardicus]
MQKKALNYYLIREVIILRLTKISLSDIMDERALMGDVFRLSKKTRNKGL